MSDEVNAAIGEHWTRQYSSENRKLVTRWWESDYLVRRINKRVCGESLSGLSAGLHHWALRRFEQRIPFKRGVSVGGGLGLKELQAIKCGLVEHFTLYELSDVAIDRGRQQAEALGLASQVEFINADGLQQQFNGVFDLVYWNNSLHHMFSVREALEWSWEALAVGGALLMDDYVGATRMQWSDQLLKINADVRASIPQHYLRNPSGAGELLPVSVYRPSIDALMAMDPSECADSENIIPELMRVFPDAEIILTGGGVYHCGLNDIIHNIIEAGDSGLLDLIMDVDDECANLGETHYAVAIAVK